MRPEKSLLVLLVASWLAAATLQAGQATDPSLNKTSDASQAIDLRGIWHDKKLDAKKARARGIDPTAIETPVKTVNVPPSYPDAALSAGERGTVRMECRIEANGTVSSCVVTRKVSALLDAEALATVIRWRYQPLKVNGAPRPALAELTVTFSTG
jgi:TonB family protein